MYFLQNLVTYLLASQLINTCNNNIIRCRLTPSSLHLSSLHSLEVMILCHGPVKGCGQPVKLWAMSQGPQDDRSAVRSLRKCIHWRGREMANHPNILQRTSSDSKERKRRTPKNIPSWAAQQAQKSGGHDTGSQNGKELDKGNDAQQSGCV